MKIRLYIILGLVMSIMTLSSCLDASSLLDKEDVGDLYEKDVFKDPTYARYFVNDIYYSLPKGAGVSGWGGAYLDCATDNAEGRSLDYPAQQFNNGNWNAENLPLGGVWSVNYASIRACNKFIENYDYIEERDKVATRADLEYLRGQVLFLRAFFYAELLKHFGGVPILDKTLHFGSPELKEARRASFDECVKYILKECDAAVTIFRSVNKDWGGNNFGRANDGVALALKGKVLALAASPLFNRPDNHPQQYDSEDPNKELWRYPSYDKERWHDAATALKAVIDMGRYGLYKKTNGTKLAYETYFVTRNTVEESIFSFLKGPTIEIYFENLPFNFMLVRGKGSPVCYNLPTLDLVSAYEMKNGMLPVQAGSGFRPLYPFSGRDPRLDATIWYDGATFCGIEFQTWRRDVDSDKPFGKDYIRGYSRTGFFLKKFMDKDLNPTNNVTVPNSYPIIRYADILLSYAEALNEYYEDPSLAPDDAICWAVSEVRARAGMPDVRTTFANRGWVLSQENVRKLIQNERRVEFAFEEHRFWDIRRWMIGEETQRVVHEQDIILKEDNKTKEYAVREIEKRSYESRMNLMPIPQSEVNKNKNLIQNWGWSPRVVE